MSGGVASTLRDTDPLLKGTHHGPSGMVLMDNADFKSCGATPGLIVHNITDGSSGVVVSSLESSVVTTLSGGTLNDWTAGDEYAIYKTDKYNSVISTHYEDRRYGHKVINPNELVDGIKADELDVDEHERNVFSPNQPYKSKRGY